jgi:hypothetical protein
MKSRKKMLRRLAVFTGGCSLVVVVLVGCGKKAATVPKAAESPANLVQPGNLTAATALRGPAPQTMPAAPASLAVSASADEATAQLTMELRRYVAYTRSIPKDFEDFAARHPMKYPAPPAGKKYVIEGGKVVIH